MQYGYRHRGKSKGKGLDLPTTQPTMPEKLLRTLDKLHRNLSILTSGMGNTTAKSQVDSGLAKFSRSRFRCVLYRTYSM